MSFALWRHLDGKAACIFENATVVEKEDHCPEKKLYNSKSTAATEPEVSKKCQTTFLMPTPSVQKGQKNAKP